MQTERALERTQIKVPMYTLACGVQIQIKCCNSLKFPLVTASGYECRKTKIKVIVPTNHNRGRQSNEAIKVTKPGKTRASKSRLALILLQIS